MQQQRLWELLGKKLAGEAGEEELAELQNLLSDSPGLNERVEWIETFWNSTSNKTEYEERETALEKHMLRMRNEGFAGYDASPSSRLRTRFFRPGKSGLSLIGIAAAVLLFVGIRFLPAFQSESGTAHYRILTASNGSKNHFILPDGSKVWLNAGTTIKFSNTIDKDSIREVFLSGEAFFEIRHDELHPFWIRTKQMDILDIGTEFNIKAYPADETAEATLIKGSIEVKIKDINHTELLSAPHEKITVYAKQEEFKLSGSSAIAEDTASALPETPVFAKSKVISLAKDSLVAETAWMKDVLVFQNESFRDLAVKMERWYDVTINFENENLAAYRFTGAFEDETIEQALDRLKLIRRFTYSVKDRKVLISGNSQ